jgi:hypothetical protein
MNLLRRHRGKLLAIAVGVTIAWWFPALWQAVSSRIPRRVVGTFGSSEAVGAYYPLDIDAVGDVETDSTHVSLNASKLTGWFGMEPQSRIVRRQLPEDFQAARDVTTEWALTGHIPGDETTTMTLTRRGAQDGRLTVSLPYGRSKPVFRVLENGVRAELVIIAAADWKVGPPGYVAFFRLEPPSR